MERNRGKENIFGQMEILMMGIGVTIKWMDMGFINGSMVVFIEVSGLIIICMDKVNINGQMERNIVEIMKMIRKMALEYFYIMMGENMKVNGLMVNSMEKE